MVEKGAKDVLGLGHAAEIGKRVGRGRERGQLRFREQPRE
jgi:hypothetical protein